MSTERERLINLFQGLRVTDVCDGLDALGRQDIGLMSNDIHPLWRDIESFRHRIYGFAHTVRFVPTNRPIPPQSPDEFYEWMGKWYRELASGPFIEQIKRFDVIVIDGFECGTVGYIGSNNSQAWINAGAVGIVTNGGCRDTDELIKQKIPVYSRYISRTIRPGRLELDKVNIPINCGGALVRPGDMIVADGDGVVVVPIEVAEEVAKQAWRHASKDKAGRRKLYEQSGKPLDFTVDLDAIPEIS